MVRGRFDYIYDRIIAAILAVSGIACLFPLLYIVSASITPYSEVLKNGGFVVIPRNITFSAYENLLQEKVLVQSFKITVLITVLGTTLNVIVTTLLAYPLSRKTLPGRKFFMYYILFTMLFNGGLIPTYLVVQKLDITNTIWAMILPNLVWSYNTLIMKSFFENLPEEMFEAAKISGAGELYILIKIVIPLSMASIMTIGLFYLVGHWNEFFQAIFYVSDQNLKPIQVVLRSILMQNEHVLENPDANVPSLTFKMAAVVVACAPGDSCLSFFTEVFHKRSYAWSNQRVEYKNNYFYIDNNKSKEDSMKRFLAVTLALVLLFGVAGCAKETEEAVETEQIKKEETAAPVKEEAPETTEPVTIELARIGWGTLPPSEEDDFIKKAILDDINVNLELLLYTTQDEYTSQLNVRIASGDVSEIFVVNGKDYLRSLSEQGALLALDPYMDRLQKTMEFIGEQYKHGQVDGTQYAIVGKPGVNYSTFWIRQDWLDNLGIEAPKTLEEFKETMKAFTLNDPDGNGKQDTYGLTGNSIIAFQPIFGAYGVGMPIYSGNFYVKDDKVVNTLYDPDIVDALYYIKDIIASGYIDPELMANTGTQHEEKVYQGICGALFTGWTRMKKSEYVKQQLEVNPNAVWVQLPAPSGPDGFASNGAYEVNNIGTIISLSAGLAQEEEKLDAVIKYLEYTAEPESARMVQFGVEGRHYNIEGDKIVPTELMATEANFTWLYQTLGRPELEYLSTKFAPLIEYVEYAANVNHIVIHDSLIVKPEWYMFVDAERYIEEEITKFVYGTRPIEEYQDFINTLEETYRFDDYVEEATSQLVALGIGK